jgi:protein involved in polysaccharide export with SLBB domain
VYVAGQVRAPGILTVAPGATVSQAIALAGGATDDADFHDIRLIRGSEMIPIDLTDPTLPIGRMTMRSGDQIVVKKGTSVFRDRIAPMASVISAVAGLVSVIAVLTTRK